MDNLRVIIGSIFTVTGALLMFLIFFIPIMFLALVIWGVILLGIGLVILLNRGEDIIEEIKWKK